MKKESEEDAVRLPLESDIESIKQNPSKLCDALRVRVLCFIMDIEELIANPDVTDTPEFLDKFAADIATLNTLSECSSGCSINIKDAGAIINQILTCPIKIKDTEIEITTLDAALRYRENKQYYDIFSTILKAYQYQKEESMILINELKILAFDLNGEK